MKRSVLYSTLQYGTSPRYCVSADSVNFPGANDWTAAHSSILRIQHFLLQKAKYEMSRVCEIQGEDEEKEDVKEKDSIDTQISFNKAGIGLSGKAEKPFCIDLTATIQPGSLNVVLGSVGCVCCHLFHRTTSQLFAGQIFDTACNPRRIRYTLWRFIHR